MPKIHVNLHYFNMLLSSFGFRLAAHHDLMTFYIQCVLPCKRAQGDSTTQSKDPSATQPGGANRRPPPSLKNPPPAPRRNLVLSTRIEGVQFHILGFAYIVRKKDF